VWRIADDAVHQRDGDVDDASGHEKLSYLGIRPGDCRLDDVSAFAKADRHKPVPLRTGTEDYLVAPTASLLLPSSPPDAVVPNVTGSSLTETTSYDQLELPLLG